MNLSSALLLLTCSFVGVSAAAANAEAAENDAQEESAGVSLRGAAGRELWMRPCLHDDCCPYLNGYYCGQGKDVNVNAPGTPDDPTKVYRCDHGEYHAVEHCDGYCKLMPPRTPDKCPHSRPNKYPTPEPPHPTPYPHPAPHPPAPHPTPAPPPPDGTCSDPIQIDQTFHRLPAGTRFGAALAAKLELIAVGARGLNSVFAFNIANDDVRVAEGASGSDLGASVGTDGHNVAGGAPGTNMCNVYSFRDMQVVPMDMMRRHLAHMSSTTTPPANPPMYTPVAKGSSIGVSGPWGICGDPEADSHTGKAFIFLVSREPIYLPQPLATALGTEYVYEIDLSYGLDLDEGDKFGYAVAIEGNLAAVSAPGADDGNGLIYVGIYDFESMTAKNHILSIPDDYKDHEKCALGSSLAIDGSNIIAGAPGCNKAFVFELDRHGEYTLFHVLTTGSSSHPGVKFGGSVDISDHDFLVGDPEESYGRGAAYYFKNVGDDYYPHPTAKIMPSGLQEGDYFATAVALEDGVGSFGAPGDTEDAGAVYVITNMHTCH